MRKTMMKTRGRATLAATAALLLVSGVLWVTPAQAQSYSGQAYGALVNVGAGPVYIASTGALPSTGGWLRGALMGAPRSPVLVTDTPIAPPPRALSYMRGAYAPTAHTL